MKKLLLLFVAVLYMVSAYAETYTTTSATATISSDRTSWTENDVTWALKYAWGDPSKTYYAVETNGLHIGSKSNFINNVEMSTSGILGKITKVTFTGQSNSTTSELTVSVGDSKFMCGNATSTGLTSSSQSYTFEGEGEGDIVINISNSTSGKNIYIKGVTVEYELGNVTLGEVSATCDGTPIENSLTIYQNTDISFHADYATSIEVSVDGQAPVILTTSDGSASWTPGICDNASVSVVAKREVEGEETQTSEPLTFNLTVKKADFITANWIITSAPSTASGQTVDVDLTLAPESSTGKWHAFAENSYSSGTSGGAQLGSKANPFNGTITLTDSDIPANAIIQEITFNGFTNEAYTLAVTVNEESAGNITVAQTTATDHKLSGFELTGNEVVFSATSASKYLCVKGISIKYTIPEEQPGEILVDYVPQYCLEANDDKTELKVMTGAELRFSSMAAAKMEITTDEEGIELPEAVNEANITWTVPSDIIATIKVTASSESGEKTSERTYTIASEEITPATPECTFDNESKAVMISTKAGALKIMAAPYTPTPEENTAMMAIEAQGWSFTPGDDPKSYEFSYEGTESTMNVSVKSVTPTKESDVVSFYVSNDGQVSGIENVATDVIAGEAVYYNLQGQRVNADRPGMYIRQQDGKAEKFIIR